MALHRGDRPDLVRSRNALPWAKLILGVSSFLVTATTLTVICAESFILLLRVVIKVLVFTVRSFRRLWRDLVHAVNGPMPPPTVSEEDE
jgi:hypothetical protein